MTNEDRVAKAMEAWSPSNLPPIGVDLTPEQAMACAFRILAKKGFSEDHNGHITMMKGASGAMYINPWGLWWEEVSPSDICVVDADGHVLEGKWEVTAAIHIHTELHRSRPDANVVVHNHPYYVTVLAAVGMLPQIVHQTAALLDGELVLVDDYAGPSDVLAKLIGDASVAILMNHGVLVTAPTLQEAVFKSTVVDRICRLTYDVAVLGQEPTVISQGITFPMKRAMAQHGSEVFWRGSVRALLREEPDLLDQ
jgi:ribulose-5-phosphate 4-epimerase/fuculose-1-phosphate aldolase